MLTQEQKDQIIESLVNGSFDLDVSIPNPIVLMDKEVNDAPWPWITDASVKPAFFLDHITGAWDFDEEISTDLDLIEILSKTTNAFDVPMKEFDAAFVVTREDDPEFIEQLKLALQIRRL